MNYQEKLTPEKSPLNRAVPGYDTEDALALMYEAALRKTFQSMEEGWRRNDDLQPLVVRLAENCFLSGIPQEEVVTTDHSPLLSGSKQAAAGSAR